MFRALLAVMVLVLSGASSSAKPGQARACSAEIGASAARALVRDCIQARPEKPLSCRVETPCASMRETIAAACRAPGAEANPACSDLDEEPDDDDEDE